MLPNELNPSATFPMMSLSQIFRPRSVFRMAIAAILFGLLIGPLHVAAQSQGSSTSLQPLVNALAAQLKMAERHNQAEYNLRHDQLADAVAAWNKSNKTPTDREEMLNWLRSAIRASMPGSDRTMPEAPTFGARATTVHKLPLPEEPAETNLPEPQAAVEPEVAAPVVETPPAPSIEEPSQPVEPEAKPITPLVEEAKEQAKAEPAKPADDDLDFLFGDDTPKPAEPEAKEPTEQPAVQQPAIEEPSESMPAEEPTVEKPAEEVIDLFSTEAAPEPAKKDELTEQPAEKPAEAKPIDALPAEEPAATEPAEKSLSGEAPAASEIDDFWSEHPASREMPKDDLFGDPFKDDPGFDAAPAKKAAPAESDGTSAAPAAESVQQASYQPPLNMGEFRARIDGFDRGLRDLEANLLKDEHPSDDQLAQLSRTMDELLRQREFLELYFKGLSDAERESLAEPQSPDDVLKLLNTRLAEADKPAFERTDVRREESM